MVHGPNVICEGWGFHSEPSAYGLPSGGGLRAGGAHSSRHAGGTFNYGAPSARSLPSGVGRGGKGLGNLDHPRDDVIFKKKKLSASINA